MATVSSTSTTRILRKPSRLPRNPVLPLNPALNVRPEIKETLTHFLVSMTIPGLKKEELRVEVKKNRTIVITECFSGFFKSFTLPNRVQSRSAKASYFDDVLQILLPKEPVDHHRGWLQ